MSAEYEALITELEHKVEGGAETQTQKHTLRWCTTPLEDRRGRLTETRAQTRLHAYTHTHTHTHTHSVHMTKC